METIKSEYKQVMNLSSPTIRDVGHRFLSIDFPSERIIGSLTEELRRRHQDNILVINMSEREYDEDQLPGHVLSVNFRGLPSPPLEVVCRLCMQIRQWLSRSPANVVAVHCFPGLSRTAVLICCYLAWSAVCLHPVDALVDVCAGLKIDVDSNPILPSQKRYLNYFFEFLSDPKLPPVPAQCFFLSKVIVTRIPNLPMGEEGVFRPFVEIWKDGRLIFSTLPGASDIAELVTCVPAYPISQEEDTCVSVFEGDEKMTFSGDLLFRVRHLTSSGGRFTAFRFAFNSNHVADNVMHLGQQELDGDHNCLVDVVFRPSPPEMSEEDDSVKAILRKSWDTAAALREGADVSDDGGSDIEHVLLSKLGKSKPSGDHKLPSPQIIGSSSSSVDPSAVTATPTFELSPKSPAGGDDVDDFFAQLEKEAQI